MSELLDEHDYAALIDTAASPEDVLDLTTGAPSWNVGEYCARYGRSLDALRFNVMAFDGQSWFRTDLRGNRHDTDIGAWERRWSTLRALCAGTVSAVDSLDMPFVKHADEESYVRKMLKFLGREFDVDKGFDWLSVCCVGRPYDRFYLTCDAADWWRELHFERRQRTNAKGARFVSWHNLEVFAISPRERDAFYCPVKDVWKYYEGSCAVDVPTPIVCRNLQTKVSRASLRCVISCRRYRMLSST